jgi:FkbM family methyltransferase
MSNSILSVVKFSSWPVLALLWLSRAVKKVAGCTLVQGVAVRVGSARMRLTAEGGDGLTFWKEIAAENPYAALEKSTGVALLIDAGANTGAVTCQLLMRHPQWRGLALEPHPVTFQRLKTNVELNGLGGRVQCEPCAAGAASGTCEIELASDQSMATVKGSTFGSAAGKVQVVQTPVRTVDELVASQNFSGDLLLKIDVEGWEVEVLKGCARTLALVKYASVECHTLALLDTCREILRSAGLKTTESTFPNGLWILNAERS